MNVSTNFELANVTDVPGLPLHMAHPLGKPLLLALSLHPVGQPVVVLFKAAPTTRFPFNCDPASDSHLQKAQY